MIAKPKYLIPKIHTNNGIPFSSFFRAFVSASSVAASSLASVAAIASLILCVAFEMNF